MPQLMILAYWLLMYAATFVFGAVLLMGAVESDFLFATIGVISIWLLYFSIESTAPYKNEGKLASKVFIIVYYCIEAFFILSSLYFALNGLAHLRN